jgi:hypothetical protein
MDRVAEKRGKPENSRLKKEGVAYVPCNTF